MTRYLVTLHSPESRNKALSMVNSAPVGARVEVKGARRTLPQNDRMWAMLTDISMQKEHHGRRYTPDQWKVLFLHALGRETMFIPALDGNGFVPWGQSSSDLSKDEMSNLIELMFSWGAEHGIIFHDQFERAYA